MFHPLFLAAATDSAELTVRGYPIYFTAKPVDGERQTYQQISTQAQRDLPLANSYSRLFAEPKDLPYLRSGSLAFDALFALTMTEIRQASVPSIQDGAFDNNQALTCACFETGEAWHYVWTRDSSYAVDLGLAWLDPLRSRETLLFKRSRPRQASVLPVFAEGYEIVQDTGTGGSWPVSSDRVVWSLGIQRLLPFLGGSDRLDLLKKSYEALVNTLEADRWAVFDAAAGLYRGEQSFLDWREQSYASWTQNNVKAVGSSKALSTNVLHLLALRQATAYAEELGDEIRRSRYQIWAQDLAQHIRQFFWQPDIGLFSSLSSATEPAFPLQKYELLGQSLAVLADLVTAEEARRIFDQYPILRAGPPVLHPQQPATAIYHNRAVWPFVTAYGMKAAAHAGHAAFVSAAMRSLLEGTALNLSNMENLEFLSGLPFVKDAAHSGPVINSRRQLWSVAAFVSLVLDGMFGLEVQNDGVQFHPHLTTDIARQWIPGRMVALNSLKVRDKTLNIKMQWPELSGTSVQFFKISAMELNGKAWNQSRVNWQDLSGNNQITLHLAVDERTVTSPAYQPEAGIGPQLSNEEYRRLFAPLEPTLRFGEGKMIRIERRESNPTRWDLYRNGRLLGQNLTADTFEDKTGEDGLTQVCYTATVRYSPGTLVSHPAPEICRPAWIQEFTAPNQALISLDLASQAGDHGRWHFNDWGAPKQVLEVSRFQVPKDGHYQFDIAFSNAFGPINTGITATAKILSLVDLADSSVQMGVVWMPQQKDWDTWEFSSSWSTHLRQGHSYRLQISDFKNMSYLEHFSRYTGGQGGQSGPINRANISGVRLRMLNEDAGLR